MTLLNFAQTQTSPADLEISNFTGASMICERLHEMGLHRGQKIKLLGRAPLNGPLIIQFGTSFLALRAEEAECTLIRPR